MWSDFVIALFKGAGGKSKMTGCGMNFWYIMVVSVCLSICVCLWVWTNYVFLIVYSFCTYPLIYKSLNFSSHKREHSGCSQETRHFSLFLQCCFPFFSRSCTNHVEKCFPICGPRNISGPQTLSDGSLLQWNVLSKNTEEVMALWNHMQDGGPLLRYFFLLKRNSPWI